MDPKKEAQIKNIIQEIDEAIERDEPDGVTALHIAAEDGYEQVVNYLVDQVIYLIKFFC